MKVKIKFRCYVFEWTRVLQATPAQAGWNKSNIPGRKYSSNDKNKHQIIIRDINLSF